MNFVVADSVAAAAAAAVGLASADASASSQTETLVDGLSAAEESGIAVEGPLGNAGVVVELTATAQALLAETAAAAGENIEQVSGKEKRAGHLWQMPTN